MIEGGGKWSEPQKDRQETTDKALRFIVTASVKGRFRACSNQSTDCCLPLRGQRWNCRGSSMNQPRFTRLPVYPVPIILIKTMSRHLIRGWRVYGVNSRPVKCHMACKETCKELHRIPCANGTRTDPLLHCTGCSHHNQHQCFGEFYQRSSSIPGGTAQMAAHE